jgi:hypothetical protein
MRLHFLGGPLAMGARVVIALLIAVGGATWNLHQTEAADPVVTDLEVEAPEQLTVGDRFRYVITIEADSGTTVAVAPAGLPEVLSQTRRVETESRGLGGGRSELAVTLEVAAFLPGPLDLPPIKLRARSPGGATVDIETPPSRVVIGSVLPADGTLTPRDLKPQAAIDVGTPAALYAALVALTIALLLVVALVIWRMRRLATPAPVVVAPEPAVAAEDRARAALDEAAALLRRGEYDAYYSTIAVTVRSYLTERFEFPAFALTTTELQERMVRSGMDRWQARLVGGLLNQCDAVVFAQYRPAPERADADLTAAYEIVEMSRPLAAPAETVVGP